MTPLTRVSIAVCYSEVWKFGEVRSYNVKMAIFNLHIVGGRNPWRSPAVLNKEKIDLVKKKI